MERASVADARVALDARSGRTPEPRTLGEDGSADFELIVGQPRQSFRWKSTITHFRSPSGTTTPNTSCT